MAALLFYKVIYYGVTRTFIEAMAQMHLALAGLPEIDLEKAQRLFVADWAMSNGVGAEQFM
jgi:hypothetical protein